MIKLLHNRLIVKYFLAAIGIAFAVFYGFCFYAFGDWAGHTFLQDFPAGPQVLGWICFAVMFGLVWIALFSKEYMKQNSHAYSAATGDNSFQLAFTAFTVFIIGMELVSVLFRVILIRFGPLSFVVLLAGLAGMALVFIISKLLHSEVNRPPSVASAYMKDDSRRAVFDAGLELVHKGKLTVEQLQRVGAGDPQPIAEVRDAKYREREEAVAEMRQRQQQEADKESQRQQIAEEERQRNQEFYEQMVAPPRGKTPDDFALRHNGKHPSSTGNFH